MSRCRNAFLVVVLLAGTLPCATASLAQDEAKVSAGLEVWKTAGCPDCHGAFANGEKERDEAPSGANLRETRLDDAAIGETVRCGRQSTGMPKFGEDAYSVRGCYGNPAGPEPDGLYPAPRNLSQMEIDAVVSYLRARVIGRRAVTKEECAAYYGADADVFCENPDGEN